MTRICTSAPVQEEGMKPTASILMAPSSSFDPMDTSAWSHRLIIF